MNENDKSKLNSAFGNIDDKYLEESAHPIKGKRRVMITRLVSSCAALAIAAVPLVYFLVQNRGDDPIPQPPLGGTHSQAGETTRHPLGTPPPVLQSSAHADTLPESPDHGQTTAGVPESEAPETGETLPTPPDTTDQILYPDLPTGPIYGDLKVFSGDTEYLSKAGMFFVEFYDDISGGWLNGDGAGADGVIANEPESIPSFEYSPNLWLILADNATVNSVTLRDANHYDYADAEPFEVKLTQLTEIHDHPGDWYLIINVTYLGENNPEHGNERGNYDHVVRITVPSLRSDVYVQMDQLNAHGVKTHSILVSGTIYDSSTDNFAEVDGAYSYDMLPTVKDKLNTLHIAPGYAVGYDIAWNAKLLSVTVFNSNFEEMPEFSGKESMLEPLSSLPVGEYYVSLFVYHGGQLFPNHGITEEEYTEEVFRLVVGEKVPPMPERMINAENVEYISHYSVYAYPTEYDFHTRYFTSPEKISAFTELLSGLEFATGEPLNIDDIILPEGGGEQVVTVKMKSGEVSEFSICANSWISSSHSEAYYELSRNDSSSISALLDSVVPDRIDMIGGNPAKLSVMQVSPNSSVVPYEKLFGNTDDISLLIECVNSLQIVDIEQSPPEGGFRWSITDPTNGGYGITFIDMKYVYVGGVWYAISGESGELLNETVSSLPSDHAVREYNHEQALGQVTVGTSRADVQIFFGMPKVGTFYEFKDGKYIEIIYENDEVKLIIVHDKWFKGN